MPRLTRRAFIAGAAAVGFGATRIVSATAKQASPRTFSFLHTYEATGRYWKALEKSGLLRPTTGMRLVHAPPWGDDTRRFNTTSRLDGDVHKIIAQRKCPFLIDRVAGGLPFGKYDFDRDLIDSYKKLLGENFLGFQLHEVISNTHNDWSRLTRAGSGAVNAEAVRATLKVENAFDQLEYGSADDYSGQTPPATHEQWWNAIATNAQRHIKNVAGHFSYCEGSAHGWQAWSAFYRLGAKLGLAEQGTWSSPQGQLSIAALRGAANAHGKPWGVSYAPWGPDGCTAFTPAEDWAWQIPQKFLSQTGWPVGPAFGTSTALQRRIFFHTYLSGASTLHEEWGSEINFENWDQPKLSSSGGVVRDLLDFQQANPDVGEPYTPLALVLHSPTAEVHPAWNGVRAAIFASGSQDVALQALPDNGAAEAGCYSPMSVPEVFDIVPSDAPADIWKRYKKIIKVEEDPSADVIAAAKELSPFDRESHLPMQINRRTSDGVWILGLYNPWGARRGDVENVGSVLNDKCAQRDVLRPKFKAKSVRVLHAWPKTSTAELRGDSIHIEVGPGGTLIFEAGV